MTKNSNQIHHDTTQKVQSTEIQTNLILGLSALSFFAGSIGSTLYVRRKGN
jgi:hypothetical protein